jgi:hypothetical protein
MNNTPNETLSYFAVPHLPFKAGFASLACDLVVRISTTTTTLISLDLQNPGVDLALVTESRGFYM